MLTVEATKLLVGNKADIICIASGDSDFSGLAAEIQACDKTVVAIGPRNKTAATWRNACNAFEGLGKKPKPPGDPSKGPGATRPPKSREEFVELVREILASAHGQCLLVSQLGTQLRNRHPRIRYSDYGKKRLSALLREFPEAFELVGTAGKAKVRLRADEPHGDAYPERPPISASCDEATAGEGEQIGPRWHAAWDAALSKWSEGLPSDLATVPGEAWDETVKRAENCWADVRTVQAVAQRWFEENEEELRAGHLMDVMMGIVGPEEVFALEEYRFAITAAPSPSPLPQTITDEMTDEMQANPFASAVLNAVVHQHDRNHHRRKLARQIIVEYFRCGTLE